MGGGGVVGVMGFGLGPSLFGTATKHPTFSCLGAAEGSLGGAALIRLAPGNLGQLYQAHSLVCKDKLHFLFSWPGF